MKRLVRLITTALVSFALVILFGRTLGLLDANWQPWFVHSGRPATLPLVNAPAAPIDTSSPDVAARVEQYRYLVNATRSMAQLIEAAHGYDQIFASAAQWPETRVVSVTSPVIHYRPAQNASDEGTFEVELADGVRCSVAALPSGEAVRHWDATRPIRVNYAASVMIDGFPSVLVAAGQRTVDGISMITGLVYLEDVPGQEQRLPLAPWGHSRERFSPDATTGRQVIDRFTTLLAPGQTSAPLVYNPPYLEAWEREEHSRRNWRLRWDEHVPAVVTVNGQTFTSTGSDEVDTTLAESPDASVVIQITLSRNAINQIPVVFEHYREPDPRHEGSSIR